MTSPTSWQWTAPEFPGVVGDVQLMPDGTYMAALTLPGGKRSDWREVNSLDHAKSVFVSTARAAQARGDDGVQDYDTYTSGVSSPSSPVDTSGMEPPPVNPNDDHEIARPGAGILTFRELYSMTSKEDKQKKGKLFRSAADTERAYHYPCPFCGVQPSRRCESTISGSQLSYVHVDRVDLSKGQYVPKR